MIEGFDGIWGVFKVISRFTGPFSDGKPFPLDEVVEFAPSALCRCLKDFFDFVFLFSIDDIRVSQNNGSWLDLTSVDAWS